MSHRHLAKSVGGCVQAHHRRRGGGGDNGGSGGEDSAGRRIQQQLLTRVAELEGGLASAQLTPAQVAAEVLSHFERSYQPAVSKLSAQIEGFGLRIQVCGMIVSIGPPCLLVRVRAEIMGAPKCRNVGESQPVPMMIDPMIISTRTRSVSACSGDSATPGTHPSGLPSHSGSRQGFRRGPPARGRVR
jgi:hypothetical protein